MPYSRQAMGRILAIGKHNYWVSLGHFAVNVSGVSPKCIDDYAVQERPNLTKLRIFATKHKVDTYCEEFFSL